MDIGILSTHDVSGTDRAADISIARDATTRGSDDQSERGKFMSDLRLWGNYREWSPGDGDFQFYHHLGPCPVPQPGAEERAEARSAAGQWIAYSDSYFAISIGEPDDRYFGARWIDRDGNLTDRVWVNNEYEPSDGALAGLSDFEADIWRVTNGFFALGQFANRILSVGGHRGGGFLVLPDADRPGRHEMLLDEQSEPYLCAYTSEKFLSGPASDFEMVPGRELIRAYRESDVTVVFNPGADLTLRFTGKDLWRLAEGYFCNMGKWYHHDRVIGAGTPEPTKRNSIAVSCVRGDESQPVILRTGTTQRLDGQVEYTLDFIQQDKVIQSCTGFDILDAFVKLRAETDTTGWFIAVQGSCRDVWPSGTVRDRSNGYRAHVMRPGQPSTQKDLVGIFDEIPPEQYHRLDTAVAQQEYARRWRCGELPMPGPDPAAVQGVS
jgi:hypothetical protein